MPFDSYIIVSGYILPELQPSLSHWDTLQHCYWLVISTLTFVFRDTNHPDYYVLSVFYHMCLFFGTVACTWCSVITESFKPHLLHQFLSKYVLLIFVNQTFPGLTGLHLQNKITFPFITILWWLRMSILFNCKESSVSPGEIYVLCHSRLSSGVSAFSGLYFAPWVATCSTAGHLLIGWECSVSQAITPSPRILSGDAIASTGVKIGSWGVKTSYLSYSLNVESTEIHIVHIQSICGMKLSWGGKQLGEKKGGVGNCLTFHSPAETNLQVFTRFT